MEWLYDSGLLSGHTPKVECTMVDQLVCLGCPFVSFCGPPSIHRRGGGGYYGGHRGFVFIDPTDIFLIWDPRYGRHSRERVDSGESMTFVEAVFSFVFGDGNPNENFEVSSAWMQKHSQAGSRRIASRPACSTQPGLGGGERCWKLLPFLTSTYLFRHQPCMCAAAAFVCLETPPRRSVAGVRWAPTSSAWAECCQPRRWRPSWTHPLSGETGVGWHLQLCRPVAAYSAGSARYLFCACVYSQVKCLTVCWLGSC